MRLWCIFGYVACVCACVLVWTRVCGCMCVWVRASVWVGACVDGFVDSSVGVWLG